MTNDDINVSNGKALLHEEGGEKEAKKTHSA